MIRGENIISSIAMHDHQKSISDNIKTLMHEKPSTTREKGIKTIQKKTGLSHKRVEQKQAIAIAYDTGRKSKRK